MTSARRRRMLVMQHGVVGGDPYVPGLPNNRGAPMMWEDNSQLLWEDGSLMRWERGGGGIEYA